MKKLKMLFKNIIYLMNNDLRKPVFKIKDIPTTYNYLEGEL